jgi:tRNA modification GTPase
MSTPEDTIVAIATPPGRGGIGIVRLSGPQALAVATPLLALKHPLTPARARFTHILDEQGNILDEAVATYFASPHSYTAEDVVEIAAHGAPVLLAYLLEASIKHGARLANPGEFTQRAFLAGRLDLTQAEAVNDLIAAQTLHQARLAAAQLGGAIARAVAPQKQALIDLIAQLEAGVDFAEDDLDLLPEAEIVSLIQSIAGPLEALANTYRNGRILREGVRLALVGRPNAGKSSLFNRLLQQDRAIVTAHPGTTRDPIAETFGLGGIPITLIDTAGLREIASTPESEAEREGIARSRTAMADADLILHIVDATTLTHNALPAEDAATQSTLTGRPHLLILNKSDLTANPLQTLYPGAIPTSALTGFGLETLKRTIPDILIAQPTSDSALITNLRQSQTLAEATLALARAAQAAQQTLPHEFLLLDLHEALAALDALTGATTPDDILARIFASFCIGK